MREYKAKSKDIIYTSTFSCVLGELFVATYKDALIMLSYSNNSFIETKIDILKKSLKAEIIPVETNNVIDILKIQLLEYFNKKREVFEIPLKLIGTNFQILCWKELLNIPYGKTISYKQQAINIENKKAVRAVANANGQNMIAIIVPCHRVISNNGALGGYNSGVEKKEYLLNLENIKIGN